jgi:hypothetical protein
VGHSAAALLFAEKRPLVALLVRFAEAESSLNCADHTPFATLDQVKNRYNAYFPAELERGRISSGLTAATQEAEISSDS